MDPPLLGPDDRVSLCRRPCLVLAARPHPGRLQEAAAAVAAARRPPGRGRLVHGRLGLRGGPDGGFALSAGGASRPCPCTVQRRLLDRPLPAAPAAGGGGTAAATGFRLGPPAGEGSRLADPGRHAGWRL